MPIGTFGVSDLKLAVCSSSLAEPCDACVSIDMIAPAWIVPSRDVPMPTNLPSEISRTCTMLLKSLPCWPATAVMPVQSGFMWNSFTSLIGPRCSQRE